MAELMKWSDNTDTLGTVGGAGTVSVVAAGMRPPAIQTSGTSADTAHVTWAVGSQTQGAGRVYFTPSALAPSGNSLYTIQVRTAGVVAFSVDYTSTGRFNLRSSSAVLQQGPTGVIEAGVTYRIEWAVTSSGAVTVDIFEGDGTTSVTTLGGSVGSGAFDDLRIGHVAGGAGYTGTLLFDDILVTDTPVYPGPWVDPDAPTGSPFKWWNGAAYEDLDAMVWGGSGYVGITRAVVE